MYNYYLNVYNEFLNNDLQIELIKYFKIINNSFQFHLTRPSRLGGAEIRRQDKDNVEEDFARKNTYGVR